MKDRQKKTLKKFIRNALLSNDFFNLLFIIMHNRNRGEVKFDF